MKQSKQHHRVKQWFEDYHEDLLRRLSMGKLTESGARDLAQEVFLRVLRISDPELVRHPKAYLMRISTNVLQEWQQRGRRFIPTAPESFEGLAGTADPSSDVEVNKRAKRVNAALRELPPMYRAAIALKTQYGFSVAEVAVQLGVTERSVKRYIEKGYAKLRHRLASDSLGVKE